MQALRIGLLVAALLGALPGHARTVALLRDERVCDESGELCLRGTLSYDESSTILRFHGRVLRATAPGAASFLLAGRTEGGQRVTFLLGFTVAGHYSEIVDVKRAPGPPHAERWQLLGLFYTPR